MRDEHDAERRKNQECDFSKREWVLVLETTCLGVHAWVSNGDVKLTLSSEQEWHQVRSGQELKE